MAATWHLGELEQFFGGPLDATGLTEASLRRLVDDEVRESDVLDFKKKPHLAESKAGDPPSPSGAGVRWSEKQEFAKDVCAFANHRGGVLLFGVSEIAGGVAEMVAPCVVDPEMMERRLRGALATYATPTPEVAFVAIPFSESADGARFCLAVVVPPSFGAPHAVTSDGGAGRHALHYPIRQGADCRWMHEPEVGDRYRRRTSERQDRRALIKSTVEDGLRSIATSTGTWLYVAVTPEALLPTRLNRAAVDEVRAWLRDYTFYLPTSDGLSFDGLGSPAPGRVIVSQWPTAHGAPEEAPRFRHCELYPDGRAFIATELEHATVSDSQDGVVGDVTLAGDVLAAAHLALTWAVDRAGAWGVADLVGGLTAYHPAVGREVVRPRLYSSSILGFKQHPKSRTPVWPVRASAETDLATCVGNQGKFAAAHDLQALILHHFGLAEPSQIRPDGSVVISAWGVQESDVARWAGDFDVPTSP